MNEGTSSVFALFASKLANFVQKFGVHLHRLGVTPEQMQATNVMAELLAIEPLWSHIDAQATEFFMCMGEAAAVTDEQKARLGYVQNLPKEVQDEAWRYIKFFVNCLREMKK